MRIIKFRAWDGMRMVTSGIMFNTTRGEIEAAADMPIMQFTGLKDSKGTDIYEGDILKSRRTSLNYKVVWDDEEAEFTAVCIEPEKDFIMAAYSWHENKVIGNIYETPDLQHQRRK